MSEWREKYRRNDEPPATKQISKLTTVEAPHWPAIDEERPVSDMGQKTSGVNGFRQVVEHCLRSQRHWGYLRSTQSSASFRSSSVGESGSCLPTCRCFLRAASDWSNSGLGQAGRPHLRVPPTNLVDRRLDHAGATIAQHRPAREVLHVSMVVLTFVGAVVGGTAFWGWIQFFRRSPAAA